MLNSHIPAFAEAFNQIPGPAVESFNRFAGEFAARAVELAADAPVTQDGIDQVARYIRDEAEEAGWSNAEQYSFTLAAVAVQIKLIAAGETASHAKL